MQGIALHQKGQLAQAQMIYRQVLATHPRHFDALHLLGVIAAQTRKPQQALALFEQAIAINPRSAVAHGNRGLALQAVGRWDDALASYDQAIKIKADYVEAYMQRGVVLKVLGRLNEALASYDRAIQIKGDSAEAYSNRGVTLKELGRLDEALASYDHAIRLSADSAVTYNNRGLTLQALKRFDEALASYGEAIRLKPDFADAHWNLSCCRLLLGDFNRGWEGYEWRWKQDTSLSPKRVFPQPLWLGNASLHGRTILLHSEQGLGDSLQFCRYARLVSELGARVILDVQRPLLDLLQTLAGPSQVVATGSALPAFDYQCPLLSLPLAFKTDLGTMPAVHSYLASTPAKVAEWEVKLGAATRPRIGLVWSGSRINANGHKRSIALSELVQHLPPQYQYVSLQKEVKDADRETLYLHTEILHLGEQLNDFADTAALCELMDLIVSVDTSVAHLAGAMGKPVWILLPFLPDWRWLLDRDDSPWYPSARLFRQSKAGDWTDVMERVRAALVQRSGGVA
jgi:tetratricopeptide (TPR) repeat protein